MRVNEPSHRPLRLHRLHQPNVCRDQWIYLGGAGRLAVTAAALLTIPLIGWLRFGAMGSSNATLRHVYDHDLVAVIAFGRCAHQLETHFTAVINGNLTAEISRSTARGFNQVTAMLRAMRAHLALLRGSARNSNGARQSSDVRPLTAWHRRSSKRQDRSGAGRSRHRCHGARCGCHGGICRKGLHKCAACRRRCRSGHGERAGRWLCNRGTGRRDPGGILASGTCQQRHTARLPRVPTRRTRSARCLRPPNASLPWCD
jgi:hypothetical protein